MIFSIHHEFMTKQHNFWTYVKDNTTQHYRQILNQNTFGYTQSPNFSNPKQIIKLYTQKET